MVTSRTGTATHKHFRREVLRAGQTHGITNCPCPGGRHHPNATCNVPLNYEQGRLPHSAEPDHIVLHSQGGSDDPSNGRVICRRCNQARCAQSNRRPTGIAGRTTTQLVAW